MRLSSSPLFWYPTHFPSILSSFFSHSISGTNIHTRSDEGRKGDDRLCRSSSFEEEGLWAYVRRAQPLISFLFSDRVSPPLSSTIP